MNVRLSRSEQCNINKLSNQQQPQKQHHHHHHHRHRHKSSDIIHQASPEEEEAAQQQQSQSLSNSAASLHNKRDSFRKSMSLLNLLGEYKFQLRSYVNEAQKQNEKDNENNDDEIKDMDRVNKKKHYFYSKDPAYIHEWKYFAIILDRILFIFFGFLTPMCLIIMYFKIILAD